MEDLERIIAHYQSGNDDGIRKNYEYGPGGFQNTEVWEAIVAEYQRRGLDRAETSTVKTVNTKVSAIEVIGWIALLGVFSSNSFFAVGLMVSLGIPAALWFGKKGRPKRWGFLAASLGLLPLLGVHIILNEREKRIRERICTPPAS